MTKDITRILVSGAVASLFAFPCAAMASTDFSFLDDMTPSELADLRDEVDARLDDAAQASTNEDPEELGAWAIGCFVDEFDRPTEDGYVITTTDDGRFSNSATTKSDLTAQVMFQPFMFSDTWYLQVFLYEYGRSQVLGTWGETTYDVTVLDGQGEKHHYTATLPEDGDRVNFSLADTDEIMGIIEAGGPVSFLLKDQDRASDSYLFTLDDCSYFENACDKLVTDMGLAPLTGGSSKTAEQTGDVADADAEEVPDITDRMAGISSSQYFDGEYTASGKGIGGDVPVTVTVESGKITAVEVGENSETQGIGSKAVEQLPAAIVAANGIDGVDGVAGASVTSKAIFTAVEDCLEQARSGIASAPATAEKPAEEDAYTDGEYTAEGKGIGGKVPVTVTIKDGKIVSVEVGDNSETQGIGSKAVEQLPAEIVEANGTEGVDAVSGASVTSKAIFTAVNDCLDQAKGGATTDEAAAPADGEYNASSKGIGGDVPVTVTIKDGKITKVEVGDNSETLGIGSKAIEQLPGAIVEANGTEGVDGVAGASVTSKAIFTAVEDCLEQATPGASSKAGDAGGTETSGKARAASAATTYTDGEYTAEGKGIGGKVPVTVTIKDGKIASVEVGDNSETQGIGSKAIEQLPDQIVKANGTDGVDAVSGASVTSQAIFTAVNDCLEQAS